MSPRKPTFDLSGTYVHLQPSGDSERLNTRERDFWSGLKDRRLDGYLVGCASLMRNTAWEMHADGDELLVVLSGELEVILDDNHGDQAIRLEAGRAFLVPRGVWHRQLVHERVVVLFVTPGPDTRHRGVREHAAIRQHGS